MRVYDSMLTSDQIEFLDKVCPNGWTCTNDVINIDDNVDMSCMYLSEFPVQFGAIEGGFNCSVNHLTTLEGGPKEVGGFYSCACNLLTTLMDAPKMCLGTFWCNENQLTSLEGCPSLITKDFGCLNNPHLKYLWGIGRIKGAVIYDVHNELNEWIVKCMRRDVIFPYYTHDENIDWIMREQKYSCLLDAPKEIREHFSPRILHLVNNRILF